MFENSSYTDVGGLRAYGPSQSASLEPAIHHVDKINKPVELPIEQPNNFELVINLKTAKQIGFIIPPNVLARADRMVR